MKALVIGATGFVGSHIARRAVGTGHEVVGFVRSDAGADQVRDYGATPFKGDLNDHKTLRDAVLSCDATIFAPQIPTQPEENRIVGDLLSILNGTDKTFIFTSGTGVLAQRTDGQWSEDCFAEDDEFIAHKYLVVRRQTEVQVRAAAGNKVRAMVVRPPQIWGSGKHGFAECVVESVKKTGDACYIGAGQNMYSNVNIEDLADLYMLALEQGRAGALYHAVSGELNNRAIAEYVAHRDSVTTRSVDISEAMEIWGKYITLFMLAVSSRSRSPRSRRELGWTPTRLDMVDQILSGALGGTKDSPSLKNLMGR